jgi:hypothetical protein
MIVFQFYLGAAFIKLFGFSFTTVRMSTLLVAMVTAFALQRTLVRAGNIERNATLGTLALVLSPLYLMLSPSKSSSALSTMAPQSPLCQRSPASLPSSISLESKSLRSL